ncbi:MAG: hypothetical protein ACXACI_15330 [Candidatus Hodarchaeales archaeon]|jgi:hypothetical protein
MTNDDYLGVEELDNDLLDQELIRIKAAETVLKRKGLYIYDCLRTEDDMIRHQAVLALWQNEQFQLELEQAILAEVEHENGDLQECLAKFNPNADNLEAQCAVA